MRIAIVASEAVPFSKTGGLADVAGTLYKEFLGMGHEVYLFVPLYRRTWTQFKSELQDTGMELDIPLGKATRKCKVFTIKKDAASPIHRFTGSVFFIGNDEFFDRDELYGTPAGDYPDNDQRFTFFCKSVLELCIRLGISPEVLQCNDWQTGLIPLYLKTLYRGAPVFRDTVSVITIHNLGYPGLFPFQTLQITGWGTDLFNPDGIEFYGKCNFLKAGIVGADRITTVSKTYAKEILTPGSGFGLDGILRKRSDSLVGIVNGIDYTEWNPATDGFIRKTYTVSDLSGKRECKKELIQHCAFKGGVQMPLICFIGRLSAQKGLDIFSDAVPDLVAGGSNILVIGKGDELYHTMMHALSKQFSRSVYFYSEFNESFAHAAYAGADIFLMPSRYEPCGLGQMIAMHYGTIPVARKTGGITDTVEDGSVGFLFEEYSTVALMQAVDRALAVYENKTAWQKLVKNAMRKDFSWKKSAEEYITLYREALASKAAAGPALTV
ncbi:MAG: glycogen synthase [Nitrospirota bacterium]